MLLAIIGVILYVTARSTCGYSNDEHNTLIQVILLQLCAGDLLGAFTNLP
jgi:hypothetical protein